MKSTFVIIQLNYTPQRRCLVLAMGPTEKTRRGTILKRSTFRRAQGASSSRHTPPISMLSSQLHLRTITIVGLQTDAPWRAMMPNGGWRMVETAIHEAGKNTTPR